mmetsp:Transcript_52805/g.93177  ORF Transcript_52805/g.93177 Transcript_52805/m.93177 type:complete len:82 (-) Transcript_52805:481-726(-)
MGLETVAEAKKKGMGDDDGGGGCDGDGSGDGGGDSGGGREESAFSRLHPFHPDGTPVAPKSSAHAPSSHLQNGRVLTSNEP